MSQERILAAAEFMDDFAERTGLSPAGQFSKRYLWTDAYAVCNFLGLYQYFDDVKWRDLALLLVDEVHHGIELIQHQENSEHQGQDHCQMAEESVCFIHVPSPPRSAGRRCFPGPHRKDR